MHTATVVGIHTKRLGGVASFVDVANRQATFVFSSGSTDRMGDIVDQMTWQLARYRQNPQFLWAHKSRDLPIGRTVKVWPEDGKLYGTVKFATAEENPFAELCWNLVKGGFLNAVSVGFIPHRLETYEDNGVHGYKLFDCELIECSLVPIPANQDSLGAKDFAGEDLDMARNAFDAVARDYDDSLAPVFLRKELEAAISTSFGPSGTKGQPPSSTNHESVYTDDGHLIGIVRNGILIVTAEHQQRLAERNKLLLADRATKANPSEVATKGEKSCSVTSKFFLGQQRRKHAARRRRSAF